MKEMFRERVAKALIVTTVKKYLLKDMAFPYLKTTLRTLNALTVAHS